MCVCNAFMDVCMYVCCLCRYVCIRTYVKYVRLLYFGVHVCIVCCV